MLDHWFADFPQVWWLGLALTSLATYWILGSSLYRKFKNKEKTNWGAEIFNIGMSIPTLWYLWPVLAVIIIFYVAVEYIRIKVEEDASKRDSSSDN